MSAFEDWWKSKGGGTGEDFVLQSRAWDAAIKLAEEKFTSTNMPSAKCQCGVEAVYHYCRIC